MKLKNKLLPLTLFAAFSMTAFAQEVELTFDPDLTRYGAFEVAGVDTQLDLTRLGGAVATNDFDELDGLSSEQYTVAGTALGAFNPFSFTVTAAPGTAEIQGDGIDVGGGDFDSGETLTFTFSTSITLTNLNFQDIGTGEFAAVTIGGSAFTFGNNTGDTHDISETLNAGDALIFGFAAANPASYNLQSFSFTPVPEPSSYALIVGACGLALVVSRRRRKA